MKENEINFSFIEEKELILLCHLIEDNVKRLTEEIQMKLFTLRHDNVYILSPKQFNKIIKEEIEHFLSFLKTKDITTGISRGRYTAVKGVGENSILTFFNFLRICILRYIPEEKITRDFVHKVFNLYMKTHLLSYIQERYRNKNKEQEQLYESLIETISKQHKEIREKERQIQQGKLKVLKLAKESIEEQNKQITAFLIYFAHETKLPLTIIENVIDTVKEEAGKRKIPSLSVLENEVEKNKKMVIDILDYEKILKGKILYNHDIIVNISDMVQEKISLFKSLAFQNDLQLTSDLQHDLYIKIAPRALDRILNNIIDNAIKYNTPRGSIHVELKGNVNSVVLIIQDTGMGIPVEQLVHIFKPYYQCVHKNRTVQGIGAGLPLVKNIVDELCGQITVGSHINRGTTVFITFHKEKIISKDKDFLKMRLSNPIVRRNIVLKQEMYDKDKNTIIVVEDDLELLSLMQKKMIGDFNFYYAREGQEALRKLKTIPRPDVIISDIMMDIMDGYEFFHHLQADKNMRDIPFIFLTAKSDVEEKLKGLQRGAIDYIEKPFKVEVVKEKIKAIIRGRAIYTEREIERMEDKILKLLRTNENTYIKFDRICTMHNLSNREREVVQYVLKGLENKRIADILCVSIDTINTHMKNIKKKCNVNNKIQLINLFHN
ncbi:MAG: response regulator [Spirochaetales bacterium]|nr:response regulator [Spirochaetales bacterium]